MNNSDPDLRAAIASICVDTNGMRSNLEAAVVFLLPVDLYVKHKCNDKQSIITDAQALKNKSNSKTGVGLFWHTPEEYSRLNKYQRSGLYQWQKANCYGSSSDTTANKINPYYLIGQIFLYIFIFFILIFQ